MFLTRVVLVTAAMALMACDAGAELVIDLRTDLSPGVEFVSVRTEVYDLIGGEPNYDTVRIRPAEVTRDSDYRTGGRIAEVTGLEAGEYLIEIALLDARESVVANKTVRASIEGAFGITAVITRDCRGVSCPDPGGSASLTSCLAGMCADPRCIDGSEEVCPDPECDVDADCVPPVACAAGRCANGVCLFDEEADACGLDEWCNAEGGCQPLPGEATADCTPVVETCNGADDDCDEQLDEGFDFSIDITNCGACGNACALDNAMPLCDSGACAVAGCNAGFGDCDAMATNGCEQPLDTLVHCGSCASGCSLTDSVASCATRICEIASCTPGFEDCNGAPTDGCETDLGAVADCGGCGVACPMSAPLCAGTAPDFACATGCPSDMPTICMGSCVDTQTDPRYCGSCATECLAAAGTPGCVGGSCVVASCDVGFGDCNGVASDGCEAPLVVFYFDFDEDGFGDPMMPSTPACAAPPGYVVDGTDCDDGDMSVGGITAETCNDRDDDCDGLIDEGLYSVRRTLAIANPGGLFSNSEAPDIAWSGSEFAVVWLASDGSPRRDVVLALVEPDLSANRAVRVISNEVDDSRAPFIERLNTEWLVTYARGDLMPAPVWAIFDSGALPPTFSQYYAPGEGVRASTVAIDGGGALYGLVVAQTAADVVVSRFNQSAGFIDNVPLGPAPIHNGFGIGWDPSGHTVTGIHVGARDVERLTLTRAIDEPPYTQVGTLAGLTPPSDTGSVGRVFVEMSGDRLVAATSARPGGGSPRVYTVRATTALTGETVVDMPGERLSMGQSPSNETYGVTIEGTFRMATFTGTDVAPPIALGLTTFHATLGGDLGPFRYVVVSIDDIAGVRLHGIGCM